MTQNRQALILERLVNGRGVFVYTREFGPLYPVLTGTKACAPFFRPCEFESRGRYFNGRIGIQSNLTDLIASGQFRQLCSALSKSPPPRLRGLPWPHSALQHLITNDPKSAKAVLLQRLNDTGHIMGVSSWLHAAAYWAHIFHNRALANRCLGNFRTALLDPSLNFIAGPTQLRTWIKLLDNPNDALPYLYETMRSLRLFELDGRGEHSTGSAWARLAIVFKEHFQDHQWSQYCLKQATLCGHDKAHIASIQAFLCDDSQAAQRSLGHAHTNDPVELLNRSFFLHVIANQSNKARQCLKQTEQAATNSELNILVAEAWLRFFDDRTSAETNLLKAEKTAEEEDSTLCYAKARHELLGDKTTTELCFLEATISDSTPTHLTNLASLYLDVLGDTHSCRTLLRTAEDMTETSRDPFKYLCRCATEWVEQVGDYKAAQRCLSKALRLAKSPDQRILCATTAIRLFNDIAKAERIMSRPLSHPRPCHP